MLASNGSENVAREEAEDKHPANASAWHQQQSKPVCPDCKAKNDENTRKLDALGKRVDAMDKKLDFIINLLGGKGQTPTEDEYNCKEKMENDMEVDGKNMDEKDVLDTVDEQLNVDVWDGEEKGAQEHFEAQMHVDDLSDDEESTPAEKVEDKCNTTIEITSPMEDMKKKATCEGVCSSVGEERSIIVYEQHQPLPLKRRSRKAAVLKTPYTDIEVYIPLNYESKHWILAEIDFIARKIIVYNSEINLIGSGKKFLKFMKPLSTLLPLLLHKIEFFSKRPELQHKEDMSDWLVERCADVPQQEKSDCGVFVIKYAENLIHGESIDLVQAEKAKYFRQNLCLQLWRSRITL
ncbi:hypothetical protein LWI28_013661 [Acer negundo]|uniref:Ubiquitin-like protease family profile domain-containing protein n=1 Tax=Acer negundo TaxID=4023 RepID=A0AAD5NWR8_ACENE|nr:hypothetical protein LWI28_013661 [Acer negundo]